MEIVELRVREAYITSLGNLKLQAKVIPVFEEIVNESQILPKLTVGGLLVEAYVVLLNQSASDSSPKCMQADEVVTHLQITTIFPMGKGGSKLAEQIAALVYEQLNIHPLNPDGISLWMHRKVTSANIPYHTENKTVWVHQIVFNDHVNQ